MLKQFKEEDFAVLRRALESGRQSPDAIRGILLLVIPLQALLLWLEYFIGELSLYPFKEEIFKVHLWISCILAVISIFYPIPYISVKFQKLQYLLSIIVSQNLFGVSFYIFTLLLLGREVSGLQTNGEIFLLNITYITLTVGIVLFLGVSIRFFLLLRQGKYRKDSSRDKLRKKFENKTFVPIAIVGSTGMVLIIQSLSRNLEFENTGTVIMSIIFLLLFYTMIFVLPEQLVILYCKCRFKSFNFRLNGRLYPFSFEEETQNKPRNN